MNIERTGPLAFTVELETEDEQRANLAVGGLFLSPADPLPPFTAVTVTLRLAGRGAATVAAQVVAAPPGALALQLQGDPTQLLAALLAAPPAVEPESEPGEPADAEPDGAPKGTLWEQMRALTPAKKILLAPKADRITRALLIQESDQQILFALLKNPRLTIAEVVRIAKSSYLSYQSADLILRTQPWMANLDVRLALVHNPKTPVPFALRLLPTLPDHEVRAIAKGAATSMPLRQAALRRVVG